MEPRIPQKPFELEAFYAYGFEGRPMFAVRAPFAMANAAPQLLGVTARIEGRLYKIVRIARQISGPIAKGEPIGIGVEPQPDGDGEQ